MKSMFFYENKDIYDAENNIPFWTNDEPIGLDNLLTENKDDYRITETISGIHETSGRIYIINGKDLDLPMPTYEEVKEAGAVIKDGQEIRTVDFFNKLIQMGYQPGADVTLRKGEYRRSRSRSRPGRRLAYSCARNFENQRSAGAA